MAGDASSADGPGVVDEAEKLPLGRRFYCPESTRVRERERERESERGKRVGAPEATGSSHPLEIFAGAPILTPTQRSLILCTICDSGVT